VSTASTLRRTDQPQLKCRDGGLGAVVSVQTGEDVLEGTLDGLLGDAELGCDLLVGLASCDHEEDLRLPGGHCGRRSR
jgi:hypothetical protein